MSEPKKGKKGKRKAEASRILQNVTSEPRVSSFLVALRDGDRRGNSDTLLTLLRGMSPIAVDQELHNMQAGFFGLATGMSRAFQMMWITMQSLWLWAIANQM